MGSWKIWQIGTEMRWILKWINDRLWLTDTFTENTLTTSMYHRYNKSNNKYFLKHGKLKNSKMADRERCERIILDGLPQIITVMVSLKFNVSLMFNRVFYTVLTKTKPHQASKNE